MIDAKVTVETQTLDGAPLEYAAGVVAGQDLVIVPAAEEGQHPTVAMAHFRSLEWAPLTNAAQMWELVDAHLVELGECLEPEGGWGQMPDGKQYYASATPDSVGIGSSKGVAVLRALVRAKHGNHVDVPAALVVSQ
jgi:hypothetical protein